MDFLAHQRKVFTLEKTKQISTHKIIIMDFYSWIIKNGGEIVKYELERPIRYGQIIPDAVAVFRLKGKYISCVLGSGSYPLYLFFKAK